MNSTPLPSTNWLSTITRNKFNANFYQEEKAISCFPLSVTITVSVAECPFQGVQA